MNGPLATDMTAADASPKIDVPIATGKSKLLGIVGDPIAQVRAPTVWSGLFRANGIDAVCIPFHVRPSDFEIFLRSSRSIQNLAGLIVTVPHKITAARWAQSRTPRSQVVGAVNILRPDSDDGWHGDIVDGAGFVSALLASEQQLNDRRALVVGAGGVGTAIAFALVEAGVKEVAVSDVLSERATVLARRLARIGAASRVAEADAEGFDLVVNASPVGTSARDPLPIRCNNLMADAIAADVVISPELTKFLSLARDRGCFVQPGSLMMDYQITAMAEFFGFDSGDWSPEAIAHTSG